MRLLLLINFFIFSFTIEAQKVKKLECKKSIGNRPGPRYCDD